MITTPLPLVSIVTPSFNSGDFLEEAIGSVLSQDYPNLEHIVMDGGSTDNTLTILQRYGSPLIWTSEPDKGQADALNKGFQRARGEIIGWLNADDTYQPHAVSSAVRYLQQNPTVSLVYSHFNFIDETGKVIYTHWVPPFSPEKLLYGNIIPNVGMFFRRHVIEETNPINPDLHYVMDWEFVLRIARRCEIGQVSEVWGNFRVTKGTKSVEKSDRFWPEIIPVLQQIFSNGGTRLAAHRIPALFWAYWFGAIEFARSNRLELAADYINHTFTYRTPSPVEAAYLAFTVIETASRPWHRGFNEQAEVARQTILRFSNCLGYSTIEQLISAYLKFYQGLAEAKRLYWKQSRKLIAESLSILKTGDWLVQPTIIRLFLYLILGSALVAKLRTLKNKLTIKLKSLNSKAVIHQP